MQFCRLFDNKFDFFLVLQHLLDVLWHDFLNAVELAHENIFIILDLRAVVIILGYETITIWFLYISEKPVLIS